MLSNTGRTRLPSFQKVQLSIFGPETPALPKTPRHTVPTHDQPTITRLSHVVENEFNMRHKWQGADYVFSVFYKVLKGREFSALATRANAGKTSKTFYVVTPTQPKGLPGAHSVKVNLEPNW